MYHSMYDTLQLEISIIHKELLEIVEKRHKLEIELEKLAIKESEIIADIYKLQDPDD